MASDQLGSVPPPVKLPRGRWMLAGAAVVVAIEALALLAWGVVSFARHPFGDSGPRVVDCSAFASFVDQPTMPAHISAAKCTYQSFQDTHMTAEFRVANLKDVEQWLSGMTPTPQLGQTGCAAAVSRCASVDFQPRLVGGADHFGIEIRMTPESGAMTVTMTAFNT